MDRRFLAFAALLLVAGAAGCSSSGDELCEQAAGLRDRAQLDAAARTYAEAQRQDAGDCADDGLAEISTAKGRVAVAVAQGRAAEDADDLTAARARYADALRIDAANTEAMVGQRRVTQRPTSLSKIWRPAQRLLDEGFVPEARAEVVRVLRSNPDEVVPSSLATLVAPTPKATPTPAPSPTTTPPAARQAPDDGGPPWFLWLLLACVTLMAAAVAVVRVLRWAQGGFAGRLTASERQVRALQTEVATLRTEVARLRATGPRPEPPPSQPGSRASAHVAPGAEESGVADQPPAPPDPPTGESDESDEAAGVESAGPAAGIPSVAEGAKVSNFGRTAGLDESQPARIVAVSFWTDQDGQLVLVQRWTVDVPSMSELRECAGLVQEWGTDALAEALATRLVDKSWPSVVQYWRATDPVGAFALQATIERNRVEYHDFLLGDPVDAAAGALGAPPFIRELFGDVATEADLPAENVFVGIRTAAQVVGIVMGVAAGVPVLQNSCLRALVYDAVCQVVAESMETATAAVLSDPPAPEGPPRPPTRTNFRPTVRRVRPPEPKRNPVDVTADELYGRRPPRVRRKADVGPVAGRRDPRAADLPGDEPRPGPGISRTGI